MKKLGFTLLAMFVLVILVSGVAGRLKSFSNHTEDETITVSAAASLRESLFEIGEQFQAENRDIRLQFNFGASGTLQKQIEEGAPVDILIAADSKSITALEGKGLILENSVRTLAGNEIVLLVNNLYKDRISRITDLAKPGLGYISIGVPESVPAGFYARESLEYYKLWDDLKNRMVYAKDAKQIINYVESGDAAAGIVYDTDARLAHNSLIAQVIPAGSHSPVLYQGAVIAEGGHQASAGRFLDYLGKDYSQEVFRKYGFTISKR